MVKYFRRSDQKMVSKLKVCKSTRVFKIALSRLIDDYPKIKDSSLSLYHLKKIEIDKRSL